MAAISDPAGSSRRLWLVIPCFNEAARLPTCELLDALERWPWLVLCLVDDGSTDGTLAVLQGLADGAPRGRVRVLSLPHNVGKGEAVRAGLCAALDAAAVSEVGALGYWDADLSTPLRVLPAMLQVLKADSARQLVLASRVKMLGHRVSRVRRRHYGGRAVATLISLTLGLPVYDSQCGAKLLAVTPELSGLLSRPFLTRWLFDVELLARWLEQHPGDAWRSALVEFPLPEWRHTEGSKVRPLDALLAPLELLRIRRAYGLSGR